MASVLKPLEGVKNMLGESPSICQMEKGSRLLAGYKTPHGLLLICVFCFTAVWEFCSSEVWSSAASGLWDFRLMEPPILIELLPITLGSLVSSSLILWSAAIAMRYQREKKAE